MCALLEGEVFKHSSCANTERHAIDGQAVKMDFMRSSRDGKTGCNNIRAVRPGRLPVQRLSVYLDWAHGFGGQRI